MCYSELIGQLQVGGVDHQNLNGHIVDMLIDTSGTLHVLSEQPLQLHSYYEVDILCHIIIVKL